MSVKLEEVKNENLRLRHEIEELKNQKIPPKGVRKNEERHHQTSVPVHRHHQKKN